jgi:hypothetical protein
MYFLKGHFRPVTISTISLVTTSLPTRKFRPSNCGKYPREASFLQHKERCRA